MSCPPIAPLPRQALLPKSQALLPTGQARPITSQPLLPIPIRELLTHLRPTRQRLHLNKRHQPRPATLPSLPAPTTEMMTLKRRSLRIRPQPRRPIPQSPTATTEMMTMKRRSLLTRLQLRVAILRSPPPTEMMTMRKRSLLTRPQPVRKRSPLTRPPPMRKRSPLTRPQSSLPPRHQPRRLTLLLSLPTPP